MKPHRPELADVFRTHEKEFLARWRSVLSHLQLRAFGAIRDCRTAALGGHLQECNRCGHRVILYNSCRNRHCPDQGRRGMQTLSPDNQSHASSLVVNARPQRAPDGWNNVSRSFCPYRISM